MPRAFTGSTAAGRALADIAAGSHRRPIPFYGELGSVNPVFVTEAALRENAAQIAEGYVASVTGSSWSAVHQTGIPVRRPPTRGSPTSSPKPPLKSGEHRALTPGITTGYARRRDADHRRAPT